MQALPNLESTTLRAGVYITGVAVALAGAGAMVATNALVGVALLILGLAVVLYVHEVGGPL
jgi:hypothetical protein